MYTHSLLLLLAVCVGSTLGFVWKECSAVSSHNAVYKNVGKVDKLSITGCDGKDNCVLKKGHSVNVTVSFTPDFASKRATTVVHGIIAGVPVPFPMDNPDACASKDMACPTNAKKPVTYHKALPVKSEYPSIKLIVKWAVHDPDADKDVFCFEVPVSISS